MRLKALREDFVGGGIGDRFRERVPEERIPSTDGSFAEFYSLEWRRDIQQ